MFHPKATFCGTNKKAIAALAISSDGNTVISGGKDHRVRLWHPESGECGYHRCHRWPIKELALSPDGATVASISQGVRGMAKWKSDALLWNLRTRRTIALPSQRYQTFLNPAFIDSGRLVALKLGNIPFFDVKTGDIVATISEGWHGRFSVSPSGRHLVFGSVNGPIRVWDTSSRAPTHVWSAHRRDILALSVSASGDRLGTYCSDGTFCEWSMEDYEQKNTVDLDVDQILALGYCCHANA